MIAGVVCFGLAIFFAFRWNLEREKRIKQEQLLPENIKQIYWSE